MKFSVSSYSFSQLLKSGELTPLGCISKAAGLGFDAIEFTDLAGDTQEERCAGAAALREEAERLGMAICAYTVSADLYREDPAAREAEVERLCRQVDVAGLLGAPVLRHDVCWRLTGQGNGRSFDRMLPQLAESARRVAEYAASRGVRTCSENHGMLAQDSDRMERLFNAVSHENYGLLVDMGNFLCVDESPVTAVSRLAPYAIHVHAKDFLPCTDGGIETRGANRIRGTVIGEGIVPVRQCLAILRKAGYDGYVTVEYEGAEPCIEGIRRGLEHLRGFAAGL